jgi:hypothetical protein
MPPLEEIARRRLARALVSLEGAIAQLQAHGDQDAEPNVKWLKRRLTAADILAHNRNSVGAPRDRR